MKGRVLVCLAAALVTGSSAAAQPRDAGERRESISVGAAGALGVLGNVAAVRLSEPLNDRWRIDYTVGRVTGHGAVTSSRLGGASVAAHARWLWHGRRLSGLSTYWIAGPMIQTGTERSEIRWPDGRRDITSERIANFTLQVGFGVDRLTARGTRFGMELSTGGNERGPSMLATAFAVWGPPRR